MADAVALATKLIESSAGPFRPEKMPDEYAAALHELVQAKIEQRAPEIAVEAKGDAPKVINMYGCAQGECAGQRPREGQGRGAQAKRQAA